MPSDDKLLAKLNAAVAAHNEAETKVATAQVELVSWAKAVGLLLLEAKELHPAVKDFEAFLKKVKGLKLSRAYDCIAIAGGRKTVEEIRQATRDRVARHRAAKKEKLPGAPPAPAPAPGPPTLSVTVTEKAAKASARGLTEFTVACRPVAPANHSRSRPPEGARACGGIDEPQTQSGGRVMADRNSIIDKIKALLAKTTANGATEAEMLSALDKAYAWMDAYEITDADVQETRDEAAILHAEPPDLKDPHSLKWRLLSGVAKFCGVRIFRTTHQTGLKCIGMPSDVQFAMWLLDTLADFVFAELYAHLIGCLAPRSERRIIIRSFTATCCERINERLIALVERSQGGADQQRPRIGDRQRRSDQGVHERARHPPALKRRTCIFEC